MSTYNPGEQGIDLKRLYKQIIHKIWIIIAATVIGAIIGILGYMLYSHIVGGDTVYRISNDYYITLNYDEYPNGVDYYNAYTWDSILRDDPIVEYALTLIPGVEKQQILDSVTGEILGDYRLLTVHVTGTDENLVREISDAYKQALPHFATDIDMISHIDVWTDADMTVYDAYTRDSNAGFLGALVCFIISVFVIALYYAIDDGIYTERDWAGRYPDIPFFGYEGSDEASVNIGHIIGSEEGYRILSVSDLKFDVNTFDEMRTSKGVILSVVEGKDKGDIIDKAVYTLRKQDINVAGVLMQKKSVMEE